MTGWTKALGTAAAPAGQPRPGGLWVLTPEELETSIEIRGLTRRRHDIRDQHAVREKRAG